MVTIRLKLAKMQAAQFDVRRQQKIVPMLFKCWKRFVVVKYEHRASVTTACRVYYRSLLAKSWKQWTQQYQITEFKKCIVRELYGRFMFKKCFTSWKHFVQQQRANRLRKVQVQSFYQQHLLRKHLSTWKLCTLEEITALLTVCRYQEQKTAKSFEVLHFAQVFSTV